MNALAKFLASQLAKVNWLRWLKYAEYLTDSDKLLYQQIMKNVDAERKKAPQQERCEAFILYWANNHAQFDCDKVSEFLSCICNVYVIVIFAKVRLPMTT